MAVVLPFASVPMPRRAMLNLDFIENGYPDTEFEYDEDFEEAPEPPGPSLLEIMPTEIVLRILGVMSADDVTNLALLNKRLYEIFKQNQAIIMTDVLTSRPELSLLLPAFCADVNELANGVMTRPRTFKFYPGLESGKVVTLSTPIEEEGKPHMQSAETVILTPRDVDHLWNWVKVVDFWVEKYPSMRWRDATEDARCLKPSEEARLRMAVARWWLYATFFHGSFWRDRSMPLKWRWDRRLLLLRMMDTSAIRELEGFMGLVWEAISKDLCASPGRVTTNGVDDYEMIPWGEDEGRHKDIVNTYAKLDPWQLRFFLADMAGRKKRDIIVRASELNRNFTMDRETLSLSIKVVLQERLMLKPPHLMDIPEFGILDHDRPVEICAAAWIGDSSPTGGPVISQSSIDAFPRENPREVWCGDDGSDSGFGY